MREIKKVNPEALRIPTKCYSQGVVVPCGESDLMFVTGQLPQDIDGKVVFEGDVEAQTRTVFSRISTILDATYGMTLVSLMVESKMDDVVKMGVFVKDIGDGRIVSRVRDELLEGSCPASTLVEVSGFVKEGCGVEIDVVAARVRG